MPRQATLIVGFILAATIGAVLMAPIVSAVNQNTGVQSVTNETVSADYNESVDLSGYEIDESTVTVYGYNDTGGNYEVASEPQDYSLSPGPGELEFNSSSTLIEDGETVRVSYDYQSTSGTTTLVVGFIPVMVGVLIIATAGRGIQKELR